MIFTDEEMRYIKYELGLDVNLVKPSILDLTTIIAAVNFFADVSSMEIRDRIVNKAETKLNNLYDKEIRS